MNEYSPFNPIMLTFFDVSNAFYISKGVVYTVGHIHGSISVGKCIQNLKIS